MENEYMIEAIGEVKNENGSTIIQINQKYRDGLLNIDGFQYLQVIWWGHLHNTPEKRSEVLIDKPYKSGPDQIGVFATRSEVRPNPILITTIYAFEVDLKEGKIHTPYIDAANGTKVLDIKPYHKTERIKDCVVPAWCDHWPSWYEDAAHFDWESEFNF